MPTSTPPRRALVAAVAALIGLGAVPAPQAGADFRISAGTSTFEPNIGASIGVDFLGGRLLAAWGDNSPELAGNPDRPSLDVAFAPVVARVAGANVNVTASTSQQGSPALAANPTDPDNLALAALADFGAGGARAVRAFSRDGGATWTTITGLPGNFGGFPPDIAFDAFGNCFLALVNDPSFGNPRAELFLSTDGGETFAPLALPGLSGLQTNVSLATGFGSVWLGVQGFDQTVRIQTLAAPVTGRGAVGTFAVQTLPGAGDGRNPDVAVGPNGQALVVYGHGLFSPIPSVSFSLDPDGLGPSGFSGRTTLANVPGYRHVPRPEAAYGPAGRAVVAYQDRQEPAGAQEVLLNFSDDDGATWSPAVAVSDAVFSRDRTLPNLAIDPASGAVGLAWYDFRSGSAQLFGDVFDVLQRPSEPRAPVDLSATALSRSEIRLDWSDVSSDETGFQIERRTANPFVAPVIIATVGPNVTTYLDRFLEQDSPLGYRVRAINGAGASRWSNGASATTLATPPAAPTNLVATAVTFQRIDLDWQPSDGADSYEVEQSTNGVDFTLISRPIVTEMMIFGLQPQTTYFFRVRAVNSGGASPNSNVASATTLGESQPAAPTEVRATALTSSRILVEWRDNAVNETRFEIQRSTGGGAFARAGSAQANAQRFTDTGLRRSTTYSYRVLACNASGCSPPSNTASATTPRR